MARALGVSASAVAQWELGETRPTHEHLIAIAAATNSDPARIFGIGTDQADPDADLRALIAHWQRLPAERRGIVLRLILAATQDGGDHPLPSPGASSPPRKPKFAA